ncbi:MAG: DUF1330 domain-containing protein [Bryobacterales bacterium]|nr:DUF1330 domain-containing protein [Bryobacterales bacterium]
MRHELLIGVDIVDQEAYAQYRAGMTPILAEYGGGFRVDCEVARVLKSEKEEPMNRVFIIGFPSREKKESFFADPRYLAVREQHFTRAVRQVTRIAEYAHDDGA